MDKSSMFIDGSTFYLLYFIRSAWVRSWRMWKWYNEYFPIKLIKTAELDPSKNYLFGSHPHGVLCSGAFGSFASEGQNVEKLFPGITPHLLTLEGHYSFPIYREFLMATGKVLSFNERGRIRFRISIFGAYYIKYVKCLGCCSASKTSMNYLLSHPDGGHAAILVVGGAPESLGQFSLSRS